jgi:hypothetical protein
MAEEDGQVGPLMAGVGGRGGRRRDRAGRGAAGGGPRQVSGHKRARTYLSI